MREKKQLYQVFLLCVLISFVLIILSSSKPLLTIKGFIEKTFAPLQKSVYINLGLSTTYTDSELEKLRAENLELKEQLVKSKTFENDLRILESQLAETVAAPEKLLKAYIIGSDIHYPGFNPTQIVIDIGKTQGVTKGQAVVFKNYLVGITHNVTSNRTTVLLVNNAGNSFTVKTFKTNALGVIKGEKNGINLVNVVLSEKLERDDLVLTKGEINIEGAGIPPGLIVGKISSIDKKPSALFQSARITPLIDNSRLSMVFVIAK